MRSGRKSALFGAASGFGPAIVFVWLWAWGQAAEPTSVSNAPVKFRVGFSSSMFVAVNEADARASIRVWALTLGAERGVPVASEPQIYSQPSEIREALQRAEVDAVLLPTLEFAAIRQTAKCDRLMAAVHQEDPAERYLLLARTNASGKALSQLKGSKLSVWTSSRMSLGAAWLESQLAGAGLPSAANFFAAQTQSAKFNKVILPVFFKQADACLITDYGFRTALELNPQVGRELAIVATSMPLIPAILVFRAQMDAELKDRCIREIAALHTSPAGQQVLNIFQSDRVAEISADTLAHSLAFIEDTSGLKTVGGQP